MVTTGKLTLPPAWKMWIGENPELCKKVLAKLKELEIDWSHWDSEEEGHEEYENHSLYCYRDKVLGYSADDNNFSKKEHAIGFIEDTTPEIFPEQLWVKEDNNGNYW